MGDVLGGECGGSEGRRCVVREGWHLVCVVLGRTNAHHHAARSIRCIVWCNG